jgi:hypothetical protein
MYSIFLVLSCRITDRYWCKCNSSYFDSCYEQKITATVCFVAANILHEDFTIQNLYFRNYCGAYAHVNLNIQTHEQGNSMSDIHFIA